MFISYFDETGDDGYPKYSSEIFVLSSIYMHEQNWKENYTKIHSFRKELKDNFGFPVNQEFHTKEFVTDKSIYHGLYTPQQRKEIMFAYCKLLACLKVKSISVVIDKRRIRNLAYDVLATALTYNVQRIENDLKSSDNSQSFLIITDEGRVGKMRDTTRKIQRVNYIKSMYNDKSYRKEIELLIEDPLPKSSKESYFIQLADFISFVISLYSKRLLCDPEIEWANRVLNVFNYGDEIQMMNLLKSCLNHKASGKNEFGVVFYP